MKFDSKYNLGEIVYLRHGEQKGIITAVTFMPGTCVYAVTWDDAVSGEHFGMELTNDAGDRFATK